MLFKFILATAGIAAAGALPQPQVTDAPTSTGLYKRADVTDSAYLSSASSLCAENSWDCCPLSTGTLPAPTPDTASAFVDNPSFTSLAVNAPTPTDYTKGFTNAGGSIQQAFGYRGFKYLDSYDPAACAAYCKEDSECRGFNIYIERCPILRPAYSVCTDPPSSGFIKCARWGYPINVARATNDASWQASFRVAIAASNGYNRDLSEIPQEKIANFTGPVVISSAAIQDTSYITYVDHTDQAAFDPAICAADCRANTAYNRLHSTDGTYTACVRCLPDVWKARANGFKNTFNTYITLKNNIAQGTRCALYSQTVSFRSTVLVSGGANIDRCKTFPRRPQTPVKRKEAMSSPSGNPTSIL